jgi:uncharacterized membrane protein
MTQRIHWVTLALLLALVALLLAWALGPSWDRTGFPAFALFVLPLLLPLPGMLAGRARAYVWAALISLLYLLHGLVTLISAPAERALGLAEASLALLLLVAASLQARWLARQPPSNPQ